MSTAEHFQTAISMLSGSEESEQREFASTILAEFGPTDMHTSDSYIQQGLQYQVDELTLEEFVDEGQLSWRFTPTSETMPAPITVEVSSEYYDRAGLQPPTSFEQPAQAPSIETMTLVDCVLTVKAEISQDHVDASSTLSVFQAEEASQLQSSTQDSKSEQ